MSMEIENQMPEQENTQHKYIHQIIDRANTWYTNTKSRHPLINSGLNRVSPYWNPIAKRISQYGEPLIDQLDSKVDSVILRSQAIYQREKLSATERKEFFIAAMKAWTSENHNFQEFLEQVKNNYAYPWTEALSEYAQHIYSTSLGYTRRREMLHFAADILSEGCDNLRNALVSTWKNARKLNVQKYVDSLREMMGDNWSESFYENVKLFSSVTKLNEQLRKGKGLTQDWVRKSREVADRSSMLILAGADELYIWTVTNFDKRVTFIYRTIDMGSNLILSARKRVLEDFQGSLIERYNACKQTYSNSELYKAVTLRMASISSMYQDTKLSDCQEIVLARAQDLRERVNSFIVSVKSVKKEDILEKEWPQNILDQLDSILNYIGGQKISTALHTNVFDKFDHDEDGVISVGDLYETTKKNKFTEWSRQQATYFTSIVLTNGH